MYIWGFLGALSPNLTTKFQNFKWWHRNWPIFQNRLLMYFWEFLGALSPNMTTNFQNSKWCPYNWPIVYENFMKKTPNFKIKK